MLPVHLVRPVVAGISIALFVTIAGCPASSEKPGGAKSQASASKPTTEQSPAPSKLPAAEFQQLPTLPPADPLPKPTQESIDPPESAAPLVAEESEVKGRDVSAEEPVVSDKPNPLRDTSTPAAAEDQESNPPKDLAPATANKPRTGKHSGIAFDPIKENGKIFEGWPKPKVAFIITGMEAGYLEPCGCAGLDRMKGGMGRRYSLFQQLRNDSWPVVGLDVGGLAHGFGRQAELKFQTLVEGKRQMGYDAIAFGAEDLRLPAGELVAVAAGVDGKPSPFLAANVGLFGFDADITPKSRIIEAGGMKIGVTAVLGKTYQKEINNPEIEMVDPEAVLEKIVPELKAKTDYLVLLAHATMEESVALGKKFSDFNVVVTSDGQPEPPALPETIEGTKTLLITVGYKGMNAIVLGLFDDADEPFRYQRVPLDSRFPGTPEMKRLMAGYQDQLKIIGFAGLGLRAVPHPLLETNGRFIGSQKCESCHEKSYSIWKKSGHGRAYDTLAKLDPPRDFDPECLSCHVIGWHPTKFFPYETGYESREKTPHLINTGCEDCHGPGEKHMAAEIGANKELQEKLRKAMVITKAESKKQQCATCHDLDNSPDFDFDAYWPFVEHYESE